MLSEKRECKEYEENGDTAGPLSCHVQRCTIAYTATNLYGTVNIDRDMIALLRKTFQHDGVPFRLMD